MNYPMIKKWLGIEVFNNGINFVDADKLEAKLAEGFEVYGGGKMSEDNFVALAIGKKPIKKQTQSEAAIAFLQQLVKEELEKSGLKDSKVYKDAKEILEMKE